MIEIAVAAPKWDWSDPKGRRGVGMDPSGIGVIPMGTKALGWISHPKGIGGISRDAEVLGSQWDWGDPNGYGGVGMDPNGIGVIPKCWDHDGVGEILIGLGRSQWDWKDPNGHKGIGVDPSGIGEIPKDMEVLGWISMGLEQSQWTQRSWDGPRWNHGDPKLHGGTGMNPNGI